MSLHDAAKSPTDNILVLGAGELGMALLRHLSGAASGAATRRSGVRVTVALRPETIDSTDSKKQATLAELRALGVGLVAADLASATLAELAGLFGRFDTVVSCTGFVAGPGTQRKLTQAAIAAGVRRYIPWQFGVDYDVIGRGSAQDLFDEQLDVRDLLRAQTAVEWVIVSTGMFTSFLFEPSFGVVDLAHDVVHALGSWETAATVTTAEDIGALTAAILFATPRIMNRVVYTAGDTLTYGQLADTVEAVLGRPVARDVWDVPRLTAELGKDPEDALRKYRLVFAQGRGVAWPLSDTFNARESIDVTDVAQWLRAAGKGAGGQKA